MLAAVAVTGVVIGARSIVALPPFSTPATVAVLLAGATTAVVGALVRRSGRPPPTPRPTPARPASGGRTLGWVVLAVLAAGWQMAAFVQSPRRDHPTLSSLTNAALSTQPVRTVAFVLWLAGMYAMGRR